MKGYAYLPSGYQQTARIDPLEDRKRIRLLKWFFLA